MYNLKYCSWLMESVIAYCVVVVVVVVYVAVFWVGADGGLFCESEGRIGRTTAYKICTYCNTVERTTHENLARSTRKPEFWALNAF